MLDIAQADRRLQGHMEPHYQHESSRVLVRWMRDEVLVVDELAHVTMPETARELLFQVIAGRAEREEAMRRGLDKLSMDRLILKGPSRRKEDRLDS